MKIEVLKGGKIVGEKPPAVNQDQKFSFEGNPTRQGSNVGLAGRLGVSLLRGLESPEWEEEYKKTGLPYIGAPTFSQILSNALGVQSEEELKPQSTPENLAQKFLSQAPKAAAFGGLPGLIGAGAGSAAGTAAYAAGAPESVQDVLQLGTEIGTNYLRGRYPEGLGKVQNKAYEATKTSVPEGTRARADEIHNSLKAVENRLGTEVNEGIRKKINGIMETIDQNLYKKSINPKSALDLRRSINQFRKELPQDHRHYADDLNEGINDFFVTYGFENPKFFKSLKYADKITEIKNMESYITRFLEDLSIPGLSKEWSSLIGFVPATVSKVTAGPLEKFARRIVGHKEYQDYFLKMGDAIAKGSMPTLIRNFKNLSDAIHEEEPEFSPSENAKSSRKIEILKGGRI